MNIALCDVESLLNNLLHRLEVQNRLPGMIGLNSSRWAELWNRQTYLQKIDSGKMSEKFSQNAILFGGIPMIEMPHKAECKYDRVILIYSEPFGAEPI